MRNSTTIMVHTVHTTQENVCNVYITKQQIMVDIILWYVHIVAICVCSASGRYDDGALHVGDCMDFSHHRTTDEIATTIVHHLCLYALDTTTVWCAKCNE